MTTAPQIELAQLAEEVGLPLDKTRRALVLLDEGNTVAFITRYRKDQTGGLDEEQIRQIEASAARLRPKRCRKGAIRPAGAASIPGRIWPRTLVSAFGRCG